MGSLRNENRCVRRRHSHPCVQLLPPHPELAPIFEVRITASHGG